MARILVTGGAGFIGSHLVDALVHGKHQVLVVDDLSSGRKSQVAPSAKFLRQDITSPKLAQTFQTWRPQIVFHLAAQKSVAISIRQPAVDAQINILGSLNVMELSKQYRVKKFIFSSTGGALYGETKQLPTNERHPIRPEAPYGIAKYAVELYLQFYRQVYQLPSIALRYANVYGPRQDPAGEAGVVAIFARQIRRKKFLIIFGPGRQTRDYIYVSDVVRANLAAMKSDLTGQINIGTGQQTSVNDLANQLMKISGQPVPIQHQPWRAGELHRSAIDAGLARRQLNWQAQTTLDQGLQKTWEWAITAKL